MRTFLTLLAIAAAPALAQVTPAAQLSAPPPPPPLVPLEASPPLAEGPTRKIRIYLTDGQELTAALLGENKDKLRVRIGSGAPFDIARGSIRAIEDADAPPSPENFFRDPNLSRTFYAPTGFRLRAGEGYFSQKELVFSSFGYGITDHISVLVGTVVPMWFSPGLQNLVAGVKVGTDFGDVWHVAAGAQGFGFPGPSFGGASGPGIGFGFVFGTVTCGTPVYSMTLSMGEAIHNLGNGLPSNTFIAVGSASWRVHQYVAIETEHWFLPGIRTSGFSTEPFLMFNSVGVRLIGKNLAADLGFVRWPGSFTPVPWVDFTYTFGG